ncbi:MAG: bifunctional precorrin-2 dehydrogenase/sirohydrochlorin ferrochelatase [Gaiellales bacterium]
MTTPAHPLTDEPFAFMACLELRGRSVLVVGGGRVGLEKAVALNAVGASLTVVSREHHPGFAELPIIRVERSYRETDLDGHWLVVVAVDDLELQGEIAAEANRRRLFCNVVDEPARCSLILPAIHREGPITVAVSTAGASPALAKRLRDDFAATLGPRHAELARRLRDLRPWAKRTLATYDDRKAYFERLVEESLA